jgi:hypothetical protein
MPKSENIYVEFVMRRSLGGFFRKQVIYRFKPEAEIDGDADNEEQHEEDEEADADAEADTDKDNPEAEQDGADVEQAGGDAEKYKAGSGENSANQTEEPAGEKGTIVDGIEANGAHAPFAGEAGEVEAGDVKDPTANGNEGSAKRQCLGKSCMIRWKAVGIKKENNS